MTEGRIRRASDIVLGFNPVRELLRHRPHQVAALLIGGYRTGGRRRELEELATRHRVDVEIVGRERLDALSGQERAVHNGFVARLRRIDVDTASSTGDRTLVVLLEDVQDPRNLGALLRVCEGSGVGSVLIRDRGSAPLSPTAIKASAGATEWLQVERITNSAQAIARLKDEGFWIYGADADGVSPWQLDLAGPIVLCFGGEGAGLRKRTRQLCDHLIGLPMRGHVESLNVASAAAAILFESVRQRAGGDGGS